MRRGGHRRCERRPSLASETGFSLLELLLVMVISTLALSLAGHLLLEAQSRLVLEAKRQVDPVGQLAAEQLTADVRLSTGVRAALIAGWTSQELTLLGHPAGRVTYLRDGQQLVRRVARRAKNGKIVVGERKVLDNLTQFRWVQLTNGAVDVEFGFRRVGRQRSLTRGGVWSDETTDQEVRRLRALPRGGGGARW